MANNSSSSSPSCKRCGECCAELGDIVCLSTPKELQIIFDFVQKEWHGIIDVKNTEILECLGIETYVWEELKEITLADGEEFEFFHEFCPFLDNTSRIARCRIYSIRPEKCKIYHCDKIQAE